MSKSKDVQPISVAKSKRLVRNIAARHRKRAATGDYTMHHHADLRHNIEFALLEVCRLEDGIDDAAIAEALSCALRGQTPSGELTADLVQALAEARRLRSDVSDDLWRSGLQAVLQSVYRHSNLRQGARDYLTCAAQSTP